MSWRAGGWGFDTFARLQELPASGTGHVHGAEGRYPRQPQPITKEETWNC